MRDNENRDIFFHIQAPRLLQIQVMALEVQRASACVGLEALGQHARALWPPYTGWPRLAFVLSKWT